MYDICCQGIFLIVEMDSIPRVKVVYGKRKTLWKTKVQNAEKTIYKYSTIYYIYQQHMTKYVQTIY